MRYLFSALLSLFLASFASAQSLNIVILLDDSGSMGSTFSGDRQVSKMDAAKGALSHVISSLPADCKIGVLTFDGWKYPLAKLDKNAIEKAIQSVRPGGGTPLGKYMKKGADALLELRDKQKYGTYKLIIITDGESSDDANTPLIGTFGILSKGISVEAIGVDMNEAHTLATKVPYRSANSFDQLKSAVAATLAETKAQDSTDYDLIASLDSELAQAALETLSAVDNAPIGTKPKLDSKGRVQYDRDGKIVIDSGDSASSSVLWFLIIFATLLVVGALVFLLILRSNGANI